MSEPAKYARKDGRKSNCKKLTPDILPDIIESRAKGEKWRSIEKRYDVSQGAILNFMSRNDMRKFVDESRNELITSTLRPTIDNIQDLINRYKDMPESMEKDHAFKAMRWMLDSAGITPTMAQSQFTVNLYQTSNTIISPLMQDVLKNFAKTLSMDDDVVNVEEENYAVK